MTVFVVQQQADSGLSGPLALDSKGERIFPDSFGISLRIDQGWLGGRFALTKSSG